MTTNRPLKVFLCHSSADKPAVRELYQKLRAVPQGDDKPWIDPWLDEEELFPGMDWNLEIEKAIKETDVILVCLSNNSITKEGYVQREIRIALDYADYKPEGTLFIIPVRLEECKPPKRLARWQYADYFEGSRERGFQRLCASLERHVNSLELNPQKVIQPLVEKEISEIKPRVNKQKKSENVILKVDPLFEECVKFAQERGQISAAMIKSKMRIGYTRASQILFAMERKELIGPAEGEMQIHKVLNFSSKSSQASLFSQNKITLSNGMEFMRVPAGEFIMGSDNSGMENEKPKHSVNISYDYWMARYPVTNDLYYQYVKSRRKEHPVNGWKSKRDHPVVFIRWIDATAYCQWANNLLKRELPVNMVLRLPTEAEWEKAASWKPNFTTIGQREEEALKYPWGDRFDKNKCNSHENRKRNTTSVGIYSPEGDSPFGCSDMSGNVWEWTNSLGKDYPYNFVDGRDAGKTEESHVVLKGGSFQNSKRVIRCAYRSINPVYYFNKNTGFRMVIAPPLPK